MPAKEKRNALARFLLPCKKHASERKAKRSGTILASLALAWRRATLPNVPSAGT